ncbi:hypothetical protein BGW36DRAFT_393147 [Talaromyces proteolyticus]|uniref:Luciferase domain-containing protein n=1 Tax=Talaromyces proteolyticus TaxID=1131652 RepID=A0AAD4Q1E7_9EURO|nr:uncharacterized protein BGW36DRAFT_393147 [Talaromyces proteolyticus]KAH8705565.1 hypothetical protein BGW36DRAFT_393147 [Talaromyces proteolyticus]
MSKRALTAVAGLTVTAFAVPPAYRDYQTYLSYGPGGPPHNAVGWFLSRMIVTPLGQEMFSTEVYQRRIDRGETATYVYPNGKLPKREGKVPRVGIHAIPQRQLDQVPSQSIREKLADAFTTLVKNNPSLLKTATSHWERRTEALWLSDGAKETSLSKGEVSHIHGTSDHSVHVILSPADAKKVIEANWGQRHALSGAKVLFGTFELPWVFAIPSTYLLIYAPRSEEEVKVVMEIVKGGVRYMTGGKEVN